MTTLTIRQGDPRHPQATALLEASHALMQSLFPAESNFYLSIDALCEESIHFFVVERDGDTVGCAALAVKDGYGEVKSMFVYPAARGTGAAGMLMQQIDSHARDLGLPVIKLETGPGLDAAHKLYHRHGFELCGAFGDYPESPYSVFMQKVF
ncbi:GNAT family N-acetyltransferase [Qingshengfaniella alkalisoli]|uniref:GNAT family N-acetyltransferase n=1 Tax=Qingshengfaniella alkalisoli TaxID=2599296 RepID=A0A5B8IVB1_9RHOB|nr:GNAT family N-acetyltransferase [Qingshengfaniella alkalisoli]QDY69554.1 GNAT family N-acetyltransferase [Qingshengfaniella alkalisoli]